jgi:hypothetical protein
MPARYATAWKKLRWHTWTTTRSGLSSPGWRELIRPAAASSSGRRSWPKALTRRRSSHGSSPTAGDPRPPWRHRRGEACTDRVSMTAVDPRLGQPPASCSPPARSTDLRGEHGSQIWLGRRDPRRTSPIRGGPAVTRRAFERPVPGRAPAARALSACAIRRCPPARGPPGDRRHPAVLPAPPRDAPRAPQASPTAAPNPRPATRSRIARRYVSATAESRPL